VREDFAKNSKEWTPAEKAKSIAYSMKLVNGVYSKLIDVFGMQLRDEADDDYIRGWNDAVTTVIAMTGACKYTKEDYMEMVNESE